MTVELRHLRSFLAIVDEHNITRAAQSLHISQPALSRTLAQLERIVGVRLVDRSTHHLTLTDAGTTFAVSARDAVRRVDAAVTAISAVVAPIRLGHNWSSATHAAAIMRSWKSEFPERKLQLRRSDERVAGLASGHVDVALVRGPIADRSFRSTVVDNEPRMAVVPTTHPLAGAGSVSLSDLANETLIVNSVTGTTTLDLWPEPPRPMIGADTRTIDDWLIAIATATGVGVTPASTATLHPHPDVRFIPISDAADGAAGAGLAAAQHTPVHQGVRRHRATCRGRSPAR